MFLQGSFYFSFSLNFVVLAVQQSCFSSGNIPKVFQLWN